MIILISVIDLLHTYRRLYSRPPYKSYI